MDEGEIAVEAKYLLEIVRKIDAEYVIFEVIDGTLIKIYGGSSEFKINGFRASDFPNISFKILNDSFTLKTDDFVDLVNKTSFACSDKEIKPALTGVNFDAKDGYLSVKASDSYRLAYKKIELDNQNFNITVPAKYLNEIAKTLVSDLVTISIDSQQIFFIFNDTIIKTRLLDDVFPDTSRLIRDDFSQILKVSARDLLNQLDRTSFIKGEGKTLVRLDIHSDRVDITSSDTVGSFFGSMPVISFEGEPLKISCSCKYLQDAVRAINEEVVTICFSGEVKPMILKTEDNNLIQLISPVRTY